MPPSGALKARLDGGQELGLQGCARAGFDWPASNNVTAGADTNVKRPSLFSISRRAVTTSCGTGELKAGPSDISPSTLLAILLPLIGDIDLLIILPAAIGPDNSLMVFLMPRLSLRNLAAAPLS